jgi:hypothetical protein
MAGRYKGPRDQFIVRPTAEVGALIRKEAAEAGAPFTEFCAEILAKHYGLPAENPEYALRRSLRSAEQFQQPRFDMTG